MKVNARILIAGTIVVTTSACMQSPDKWDQVSGTWTPSEVEMRDGPPTVTYKLDGDSLRMRSSTGRHYNAKLDGGEAPIEGDSPNTVVRLMAIPVVAFQETTIRNGQTVNVSTIVVAGRNFSTVFDRPANGQPTIYTAAKK